MAGDGATVQEKTVLAEGMVPGHLCINRGRRLEHQQRSCFCASSTFFDWSSVCVFFMPKSSDKLNKNCAVDCQNHKCVDVLQADPTSLQDAARYCTICPKKLFSPWNVSSTEKSKCPTKPALEAIKQLWFGGSGKYPTAKDTWPKDDSWCKRPPLKCPSVNDTGPVTDRRAF